MPTHLLTFFWGYKQPQRKTCRPPNESPQRSSTYHSSKLAFFHKTIIAITDRHLPAKLTVIKIYSRLKKWNVALFLAIMKTGMSLYRKKLPPKTIDRSFF